MTRIAFVGLGKLGLPVALCLAQKHRVAGYDISPSLREYRTYEHRELGPDLKDDFQEWFRKTYTASTEQHSQRGLSFAPSLEEAVNGAEIIFVAVQTPHAPEYEGITRVPPDRADFDYTALKQCVTEISQFVKPDQIVVVISTVLPGTMRREILPLLEGRAPLVYNPAFPAMGTVMEDFLRPEFVLLGADDQNALRKMHRFYNDFYRIERGGLMWYPEVRKMSIESAELTKVAYNVLISQKIALANTLQEICHKIPNCNVDDVTGALKCANRRLISTAYMDGGVGDSGPCHPRDGIAMSYLAQKLQLAHDPFGEAMKARERQAEWLVNLFLERRGVEALKRGDKPEDWLPVVFLGKAYKPESSLVTGSAAILMANILKEKYDGSFWHYDPYIDGDVPVGWGPFEKPSAYLICTKHKEFASYKLPKGSLVVDPFRYIPEQADVKIIRVGVGK